MIDYDDRFIGFFFCKIRYPVGLIKEQVAIIWQTLTGLEDNHSFFGIKFTRFVEYDSCRKQILAELENLRLETVHYFVLI